MPTTQQRLEALVGNLIVQNYELASQNEALTNSFIAATAKLKEFEQAPKTENSGDQN